MTRADIERVGAAVERFELGSVAPTPLVTGFLIAPDWCEHHVVTHFSAPRADGAWETRPEERVAIDWTP